MFGMRGRNWRKVSFSIEELLALQPPMPENVMNENLIELCGEWIDFHLSPTKTIRPKTSYEYKHDVEDWTVKTEPRGWVQVAKDVPWTRKGERIYIPEPCFVEAMIRRGYRVKHPPTPPRDLTIEAQFNATRKK